MEGITKGDCEAWRKAQLEREKPRWPVREEVQATNQVRSRSLDEGMEIQRDDVLKENYKRIENSLIEYAGKLMELDLDGFIKANERVDLVETLSGVQNQNYRKLDAVRDLAFAAKLYVNALQVLHRTKQGD